MPSPFPGMNPYLENPARWQGFHNRYVIQLANQLTPLLRPRFIAKLEERLYIHELSAAERRYLGSGDVSVARFPALATGGKAGAAVADAPQFIRLPAVDMERLLAIEVTDRENQQVVTVIEALSPANKKPGADRDTYLNKRDSLLHTLVNFIELDLLRGGPKLPLGDAKPAEYYALLRRLGQSPLEYWPISLRQKLPTIPVPLVEGVPDATLDLQAALHAVYDAAAYGDYIYVNPPVPPLSPEDQAWADGLLRESGIAAG